jgi:hypothetical protein
MTMNSTVSEKNTISELEFRIDFRDEFGIDYQEALSDLKEKVYETERLWNQTLVKHGVI